MAALAGSFGADRSGLVSYEPIEAVEAVFGRYPALDDSATGALGFRDDGTIEQLIRNALCP